MEISRTTATRIVTDLADILRQDINFIDATAHIIAGTNPARIGNFHGGAQKLLERGLPELVIYNDDEYEGTRRGINLPIALEGQTVGVIGITGDSEEIGQYGRIIKKMTEILLLDDLLKAQKRRAESDRNRFVQEWVFGDAHRVDQEFINLGLTMDVDVNRARRVLVASTSNCQRTGNYMVGQTTLDGIERAARRVLAEDGQNILLVSGSKFVCLVTERPDEQLLALTARLCAQTREACGVELKVGIDSVCVSGEQLHESCKRAEKALWGSRLAAGRGAATFYSDIGMELFVNDLPEKARREFVHKIFKGCTDDEIRQWVEILSTLFACNGSIGQTAQRLFLHKNTLQYRLNKLRERTGYDPRDLGDSSLFYIAIVFFDSDSGV